MRFPLILAAALLMAAVLPLQAQERPFTGGGRLFTNDLIGDGEDRWRTGSYVISKTRSRERWTGERPSSFGDLIEYRFRSEIIAPAVLGSPSASDRRYAGILSFGLHTHFQWNSADVSLGGDLVVTGEQTGIGRLQEMLHELVSLPSPSDMVLADQIANGFYPTVSGEIARSYRFFETAMVRPFVEGRAGDETLVRIGADILIGGSQRDLLLRDVTTGQLYRGTNQDNGGISFVLGADIAKVLDSVYLPASDGYQLTDSRSRLRAGVTYQKGTAGLFYGLTWLGKEFKAQAEAQVVGSLRLYLQF